MLPLLPPPPPSALPAPLLPLPASPSLLPLPRLLLLPRLLKTPSIDGLQPTAAAVATACSGSYTAGKWKGPRRCALSLRGRIIVFEGGSALSDLYGLRILGSKVTPARCSSCAGTSAGRSPSRRDLSSCRERSWMREQSMTITPGEPASLARTAWALLLAVCICSAASRHSSDSGWGRGL